MTQKHIKTYSILDQFALRTPLFPLDFYKKVLHEKDVTSSDFQNLLKNPILKESIYLASPELYSQIIKWEKGYLKDAKKVERLHFAILKYFTRITTRCTPFGLFASCTSGSFTEATAITLKESSLYNRVTRFDTTFLSQLYQVLLEQSALKAQLLFYPNTSLYAINDHYRYVEYSIVNKRRSYSLEGIMKNEALELIIEQALKGKTIKDLATLLVEDEISLQDGLDFIEELIEHQILVSELEITVTGEDYFTNLLHRIKDLTGLDDMYQQLLALEKSLKNLDIQVGNSIEAYQETIELAQQLVPELDTKYLFQTDCFSTTSNNTLNSDLKKQLSKAFTLFNKMKAPSEGRNLADFARNFTKRFEQSEVPLHLALDTETGIGYGSKKEDSNPILDDIAIGNSKPKRYQHIVWTDLDDILHHKLITAAQHNDYVITLQESDFKDLPLDHSDLPDTLSSIIEIYGDSQFYISGAGGSSAANLLGRFSHGEKALLDHVQYITTLEQQMNKDAILAEIVHLPEARTGNILQRPQIRNYEIPYLGNSSVEKEFQIPIEDLMVSVRNESIILRSKKLNKEILPRLGNAHNYSRSSLPIYQFLCEIQSHYKRSWIGFQWHQIHEKHAFLPRVSFENMIFSKARWNIETASFKKLLEEEEEIMTAVEKWQSSLQLPDYVELIEGDNKLLIHLKNKTSVTMLGHTIKNKTRFILEEFLFKENGMVTNQQGNSYCNQFVVSFYNKEQLDDEM